MSRSQSHSKAGRIRPIEKSNGLIVNGTRNLPACSIVSQPTTSFVKLMTYKRRQYLCKESNLQQEGKQSNTSWEV
jgi:hypothetical protein